MEKEYMIIITSNTGDLSKQYTISERKWKRIKVLGIILGLLIIAGIVFYGKVYYTALRVKALEAENRRLKEENKKIRELERKLAKAEELRAKIFTMLGVEKTPEIKSFISEVEQTSPRKETSQLELKTISKGMRPLIQQIVEEEKLIPTGFPVKGVISRGFSYVHPAVDIVAALGTEVYATAEGVVKEVRQDPYYGNVVVIAHGDKYETLYAHLMDVKVSEGQRVKKGTLIGHLGNTGKSTGPHLHYEVHVNGEPVDPMKFLLGYGIQTAEKR